MKKIAALFLALTTPVAVSAQTAAPILGGRLLGYPVTINGTVYWVTATACSDTTGAYTPCVGGSGGGGSTDPTYTATPGSAVPTHIALTGGSDGTNARTFLTDTAGRQIAVIYSLPAITGTVTANLGALNGAATSALQSSILSALGAPMQQSGGSVTANIGTIAGLATAAKQPALGTAGTPSADVITIQGAVGGTPQPISGTVAVSNQPSDPATGAKQTANTNQIAVTQAAPGSDAASAQAVQGVTGGKPVPVSAAALPLPAGAAQDSSIATLITRVNALVTALGSPEQAGATKPVSAIALPLPTGAATDATNASVQANAGSDATKVVAIQGVTNGKPVKADTVVSSTATNRSAVIGFSGTSGTATSASTTLTTATMPSLFTNSAGTVSGIPQVGQIIAGTGITAGTTITAVSGSSPTYTLTLSAVATVAAGAAITSVGPQTVMPVNASRRGIVFQTQGAANCWINGTGNASATADSLKLVANGYYDSPPHHVGTAALSEICDTAATPQYIREF